MPCCIPAINDGALARKILVMENVPRFYLTTDKSYCSLSVVWRRVEDNSFIAHSKALPGLVGVGQTPQQAIEHLGKGYIKFLVARAYLN